MRTLFLIIFLALMFHASASAQNDTLPVFQKLFDENHVKGSFVLYDLSADKYTFVNPSQFNQEFRPASTFKIFNSLIILEMNCVPDETVELKWDKKKRSNPAWNKDTDMRSAFKNSTVWFYQTLAKKVGMRPMQEWINRVHYGNMNIGGGIDKFWLTGDLRITPAQQIDFLKRLYKNELPFMPHVSETVKRIMVVEQNDKYILRAKTGLSDDNTGWYVGYVETRGNAYFFATCLQSTKAHVKDLIRSRTEITEKILKQLGVL
jgi:beta-lactamase class D